MKIINSSDCSLAPHCWDHIEHSSNELKREHRDSVLLLNGKTYWPASLLHEWEAIIVEAIQKIEDQGAWVPTRRDDHKSIAWKLFTHKGIELHLSITKDDNDKYWIHAYPTEKQTMSGRHVLKI